MYVIFYRAVELGITAEDLIIAEEQEDVSSPRRPLPAVDSDGEVTRALVYISRDTYLQFLSHVLLRTNLR